MNKTLQNAKELHSGMIQDRRYLHQNPEVGTCLPNTTAFITKRLLEMGYEPKEICKGGIVASAGKRGGNVILLRADVDALPMEEDSGVPYQSTNGSAHACGHDMHTAMLLAAAKLLKEKEDELQGEVRLMFQPDEESLTGAKSMIEAGVLEGVNGALALHVLTGKTVPGSVILAPGVVAASQDRFVLTIEGKGTHGAMPHFGVDPISIGSHIVLGLQQIVARELDCAMPVVLTIGSFQAGSTANIIPQTAVLEGTIRALSTEARQLAKQRFKDICRLTAETYRGTCKVEFLVESPCNYNDPALTEEFAQVITNMGVQIERAPFGMGSEDFAYVSEQVPSLFFALAAGGEQEEYHYPLHSPKVQLNEDALPYGAAILTECAIQFLEKRK